MNLHLFGQSTPQNLNVIRMVNLKCMYIFTFMLQFAMKTIFLPLRLRPSCGEKSLCSASHYAAIFQTSSPAVLHYIRASSDAFNVELIITFQRTFKCEKCWAQLYVMCSLDLKISKSFKNRRPMFEL